MNIFNFGSMRDLRVFEVILGHKINKEYIEDGKLIGYVTVKVKNQVYPVLKLREKGYTLGYIYNNLTPNEFKRIEFYEENLYQTKKLPIYIPKDGIFKSSMVYVEYDHNKLKVLKTEPWNFQKYQDRVTDYYLDEVKEFMKGYHD